MLYSGYILKVEPARFADGLNERSERREASQEGGHCFGLVCTGWVCPSLLGAVLMGEWALWEQSPKKSAACTLLSEVATMTGWI